MAALGACLLLAACGGSQPQKQQAVSAAPTPANYYVGSRAVHAHLEQGSGGSWVLKTVTESDAAPEKGYLVRLNDLAPAFDIRVAECEPQAYPANHKCNPAQPFRERDIGVMDKIINSGLAAGTAGKVTGVSRTYRMAFDPAAFNQAVDEALINTGLADHRRDFLLTLDRYAELVEEGRSRLQTAHERTLSRYRNTQQVTLDIRPRIEGLSEYYAADIDFRDIVKVHTQGEDQGGDDRTRPVSLETQSILPCQARNCVAKARNAMADLRLRLSQESEKQQAALSAQTATYALQCDATSHAGYSFVLDCPETIPASGAATETVPVTMTILSRDFDVLYPEFVLGDEKLGVEIDGEVVRFINRTSDYLSVVAQTVYYNSQVETRRTRIDVAPGVAIERPIDEFVTPAIRVESSFRDMTPDKARGTTFRFGFATSYRIAGNRSETTLYDLREFNAGCVIDNRIRPGSCRRSVSLASEPAGEREDVERMRVEEPPRQLPMPR